MKKLHVLCAVFMLCLVFTYALAETIQFEYHQSFDYTREVARGNFRIMIPSSFTFDQEYTSSLGYTSVFTNVKDNLLVSITYDNSQPRYRNAGELIDAHLEFIRAHPGYDSLEFARADECMSHITTYEGYSNSVSANIYNIDESLYISVGNLNLLEDPTEISFLRSLINGILEHIVAPEMPL